MYRKIGMGWPFLFVKDCFFLDNFVIPCNNNAGFFLFHQGNRRVDFGHCASAHNVTLNEENVHGNHLADRWVHQ